MKNKLLAGPYLVWMVIFTLVPLGIVIYYAFTSSTTGEFTLDNLAHMGTYLPIFLRSIGLAAIAALICLIIGYPVAYYIASTSEKWQKMPSTAHIRRWHPDRDTPLLPPGRAWCREHSWWWAAAFREPATDKRNGQLFLRL